MSIAGSSVHRGTQAAAWFRKILTEKGDTTMQSYVLVGGLNAWAEAGSRYVQLMDGYREDHWHGR